jgi:hypothetical protein
MTPLFEMPQLLTLSGDSFNSQLGLDEPNYCTNGCGSGCHGGCDVGGGVNGSGGGIDPDIKV